MIAENPHFYENRPILQREVLTDMLFIVCDSCFDSYADMNYNINF